MILKKAAKVIIVASSLLAVHTAHAALVSCPTSFTANTTAKVTDNTGTVSAASDCEYLNNPDQNNVASVGNINNAGFFGFSDWVLNTGNDQRSVEAASGTWAITAADFAMYDYMIVFKDGADTNLVAFLLDGPYASGRWSTPFTTEAFTFTNNGNGNGNGPTQKNVSHYTIVQRENGEGEENEVPEPGMLGLLGIGLLGYTAARRRVLKK